MTLLFSTVAAVAAAPPAANAVVGSGLTSSTLASIAKITILPPGTSGAVACTGVLVGPRLVLTSEACLASGNGTDPQPTTAWPMTVGFTGMGAAQSIRAVGVRYDHGRGLALLGLAKAVPGITPVPVGTLALAVGNTVRVAGFGRTGADWISDAPHEAAFTVAAVANGAATVTGDGSLCVGDAGAAALRTVNGAVELVGIATGGGRKGCLGDDSTSAGGTTAITTDLSSRFDGDPLGRSVLTPSDNGNPAASAAAFGSTVVTGDFDKNGYLDVVVGAPTDQINGAAAGAVTVYSGSAAGLGAGHRLVQSDFGAGDEAGDGSGSALAAGDFNKDGYADLAIGLPTEAIGTVKSGMIAIYYGKAVGLTTGVVLTQTTIGNFANEEGDLFGAALAAGDFNNDGYADLAVGAPGEQQAGVTAHSGSIFVLKGSASGLVPGWTIDQTAVGGANEEGDRFGAALAAGNVTSSVHADLVVGAPGEAPGSDPASGAIYVIPGAASGVGTGFGRNQSGNGGSNEAGDEFGASVAVADFDHDGYSDVVAGSPGEAPGSDPKSGTATIFPGQASQVATGVSFGEGQFGDARGANDRFGSALAVGDADSDGYADVLIGAPGRASGSAIKAGVAYLLRGHARSSTVTLPGVAAGRINRADVFGTDEANDAFGTGLSLGDLNNDGKADAVIGAPGEAISGEPAAGMASVFTAVAKVAADTASAPANASTGAGSSIVEGYSYPDAAEILARQNVRLISGDGHILFADCATAPVNNVGLLQVWTTDEVGANADGLICFKITATIGLLNLEVPAVYEIRGDGRASGAGHDVTAYVRSDDGESASVEVNPTSSTQVGIGISDDNSPTTLLKLTVTG